MTKLQLALDQLYWKDAAPIVSEIGKYVDIIEFGTPLVKGSGCEIIAQRIKTLRSRTEFKDKEFLIDTKAMDVPAYEGQLVFNLAKADYMTIMALTPYSSKEEAVRDTVHASNGKNKVFFDLMDVHLPGSGGLNFTRAREQKGKNILRDILDLHVKYGRVTPHLCVHSGISQQLDKKSPDKSPIPGLANLVNYLEKKKIRDKCVVAVAGGVKIENIDKFLIHKPDVVIVGGNLTGDMTKSTRIKRVKAFQEKLGNPIND
jgi:3-hexulose-6-phosphate synthase